MSLIPKESHPLPPGPRGLPLLGNLLDFISGDPIRSLLQGARDFGDLVRFRIGPLPVYLINHPDYVRHVLQDNHQGYKKSFNYEALALMLGKGLVTSEGALWLRQRRLAQPAFQRQRLLGLLPTMVEATSAMLARWQAPAREGRPLDVHQEMMHLALSIASRTLFSVDLGDLAGDLGAALTAGLKFVERRTTSLFRPPLWVPTPQNRLARRVLGVLNGAFQRIIEERRRDPVDRGDLLSLLLSARDEETGTGMDDQQLRDEVLTLLVAGHETTANALTWSFYLLSQHPAVRQRLAEEAAAVLADGSCAPGADDLAALSYTQQVVLESMRLYPPVWNIERQAIRADEIGGYRIAPDTLVMISPYTLHRHPRYWEDPERFDPDRFLPGRAEGRPRYAYMPFAGGPRQCIGNNFALMEVQVVLAMVARRFELDLFPGHPVSPVSLVTLRPRHGMKMTLKPQPLLR